ncbi:MAG TPA: IS200/IS605 family transposase [Segetibacter sp.]|nr:IS200/IS605 family transposase [Segetibacter sp.]
MSKYKRQSHVVYKCDYDIVWVSKYRLRILTGEVGKLVDQEIRKLSEWLGCEVMELNVQADHVHVVVSIPPKVSV